MCSRKLKTKIYVCLFLSPGTLSDYTDPGEYPLSTGICVVSDNPSSFESSLLWLKFLILYHYSPRYLKLKSYISPPQYVGNS